MERRAFLALIASAPIAALAPWPHFLPPTTIYFTPHTGNQIQLYRDGRWESFKLGPLMRFDLRTGHYIDSQAYAPGPRIHAGRD